MNGKGSTQRPTRMKIYRENFSSTFSRSCKTCTHRQQDAEGGPCRGCWRGGPRGARMHLPDRWARG